MNVLYTWLDSEPCRWNEFTLLTLISSFIEKEGLSDKLNDFLQECEDEEVSEFQESE